MASEQKQISFAQTTLIDPAPGKVDQTNSFYDTIGTPGLRPAEISIDEQSEGDSQVPVMTTATGLFMK